MASYLRTPSVERLPVILEELHTGSLRIPPFQRDFEWTGEQRLNLFDSILKGLPTGSLMVWRTTHALRADPLLGPFALAFHQEASQYLLDGRQRMTTLYAALAAGFWTREDESAPERKEPNAPDGTPWEVFFDLNGETFVTGHDEEGAEAPKLPLNIILDDAAFDDWRARTTLTREQVNRARNLRSAFIDYLIPVVPLATDDIGVVTMTFKRVNSGGTPMGDADMTRALAWTDGYDLRQELEAVRQALLPSGWDMDDDTILKAVAGIALPDPTTFDAEDLAAKIKDDATLVPLTGELLGKAVLILDHQLGIRGMGVLPNVQILLFAARALHAAGGHFSPDQEAALATWAAEACLDERFGVTANHMLRAYFRALQHRLGLSKDTPPNTKRRSATECWKFRMIWARSRGTALVLAAEHPTDPEGNELADVGALIAAAPSNIGMLLSSRAEGLPPHVVKSVKALRGVELQSPANRFVCVPHQLPALRRVLCSPECPEIVRLRHLVDVEAHRALVAGDLATFFERRRIAIRDAEQRWVERCGGQIEIVPDQRSYSQG